MVLPIDSIIVTLTVEVEGDLPFFSQFKKFDHPSYSEGDNFFLHTSNLVRRRLMSELDIRPNKLCRVAYSYV